MRGRTGWWRKVLQPDGTFATLTEEQAQAHTARTYTDRINADALDSPEKVAEEKRQRIGTGAFAARRQRGVQERDNVKARILRLDQIAAAIRERGWEGRPAAYIARQLAKKLGVSETTARLDVREARTRHAVAQNKT